MIVFDKASIFGIVMFIFYLLAGISILLLRDGYSKLISVIWFLLVFVFIKFFINKPKWKPVTLKEEEKD